MRRAPVSFDGGTEVRAIIGLLSTPMEPVRETAHPPRVGALALH